MKDSQKYVKIVTSTVKEETVLEETIVEVESYALSSFDMNACMVSEKNSENNIQL